MNKPTQDTSLTLSARSSKMRLSGTILIWAGVLSWVPYIYLRYMGQNPSILIFLPIHLIGVLGGARLRAKVKKNSSHPKQNRLKKIGRGLIIAGVLTWILYFAVKYLVNPDVIITPYLSVHLSGVLGGLALLLISAMSENKNKPK